MPEFMGTVTLQIEALAEKRGIMNANQLHEETGISYDTCYRLFNEEMVQVGMSTLAKLCDRLKVKPGDLFSYTRNGSRNGR